MGYDKDPHEELKQYKKGFITLTVIMKLPKLLIQFTPPEKAMEYAIEYSAPQRYSNIGLTYNRMLFPDNHSVISKDADCISYKVHEDNLYDLIICIITWTKLKNFTIVAMITH